MTRKNSKHAQRYVHDKDWCVLYMQALAQGSCRPNLYTKHFKGDAVTSRCLGVEQRWRQ